MMPGALLVEGLSVGQLEHSDQRPGMKTGSRNVHRKRKVLPRMPHRRIRRLRLQAQALMTPTRTIFSLIGIGIVMTALVWVAPAERTLGTGIRSVYLHVAVTWAGLTGLWAAGCVGAILLFHRQPRLERALFPIGFAGLTLYTLGFAFSLLAATVNWGGVLWGEPRVALAIRIITAGVLVLSLNLFPLGRRFKGFAWTVFAAYVAWSLQITPLYFHPTNPIGTSTSLGIRMTFYALFVLALAACAILALRFAGVAGPGHRETRSGQ